MKTRYAIEWTDDLTGEIGYCETIWDAGEYRIACAVAKAMDDRKDGYSHKVVVINEFILEKIGKL